MIDVRVIKLISGEEVIGRFVSEDDTQLVLERTLSMILQHDQHGNMGMITAPFLMSAGDRAIKVNKATIVGTPVVIDEGLVKDYLQKTSPIALS